MNYPIIKIKMKEVKNEFKKHLSILLRFSPNGKNISMVIPNNWNVKKIKNFINYAFKDDVKNNKIIIYHGGKILSSDNLILNTIFKEDLNQLIVTLKSKEDLTTEKKKSSLETLITSNSENKKETLIMKEEFEKLEQYVYHCYDDILGRDDNCSPQPEKEMINKLPLFHKSFESRIKLSNEKKRMSITDMWDSENIDNYATADYFKVEVFFKLFFFFIFFGAHIKGYNIPFFISLLIFYYWYCLYIDINQFYQKKIDEIKLTQEEMKELEYLDSEAEDGKLDEEDDEAIFEVDELTQDIYNLEKEEIERNKLLSKNENTLLNEPDNILVEDMDVTSKEIKNEVNINTLQVQIEKNHTTSKFDKKTKKLKETKQEGTLLYYFYINLRYFITFTLEAVHTFLLSLFPMWCDEFEQTHPVIARLINQITNTANNHTNNENILHNIYSNTELVEHENEGNENEFADNFNIQEQEINNINDKAVLNEFKSQTSDKILVKSSNDTRIVNPSECQNKYFLVEENENKTENEYVFSENINIDTLSYNEPIIESWKKKHEREIEDEAEANLNNNK